MNTYNLTGRQPPPRYDVSVKDEGEFLVLTPHTPVALSLIRGRGAPSRGGASRGVVERWRPAWDGQVTFAVSKQADLERLLADLIVADDLGRVTNLEDLT